MRNRDFVNEYLTERYATDNLLFEELRYKMDGVYREEIEDEEPYDLCDALFDVEELAEIHKDSGDSKKLLKASRQMLIEVGYYRVIERSELDNIFWFGSSGSGRATCNFRLNKKMYWADDAVEVWKEDERD